MSTATMSISLPKELKEYVRKRTTQELFGTPSDFIRSLIRDDRKHQGMAKIERLLETQETMDSQQWQSLRGELLEEIHKAM
jgi:antitoxin ParD1/3/4